jgi:hypothetical protein
MREAVVAVELYVLGNESATAAHETLLLVWGFVTGVVVGLEVAEERQDGRRSSGRDGPWTL